MGNNNAPTGSPKPACRVRCPVKSKIGHIAPWGTNEFALDFHKNGLYRRVDVGIDPYDRSGSARKLRRGGRLCPPKGSCEFAVNIRILEIHFAGRKPRLPLRNPQEKRAPGSSGVRSFFILRRSTDKPSGRPGRPAETARPRPLAALCEAPHSRRPRWSRLL